MSSRRKPFSVILGLAAFGLLAIGCANQNTSYRVQRIGPNGPRVITQDAKTRNLVIVPESESGRANQWRVCAEASPDVFSALSASASGDLGLNTRGAGTEAQARAAFAIAEAAGTIERTQTINMLRESMYRTCERYMSGAIDRATFVVQAGRDWRAMIAILAIEQLTRAARGPSTIISGGTTSTSVTTATDIARQREIAQRAVETATTRRRAAQDAVPAGCPPTAPAVQTQDCTDKIRDRTRAEEDLTRANQNLATWDAALKSPPPANQADANTGIGPNNPGAGGSGPSDTAIQQVVPAVREIVARAFDTDETQLFCLQVLVPDSAIRRTNVPATAEGESIQQLCVQYLAARVQSDISTLRNWQLTPVFTQQLRGDTQVIEAHLTAPPPGTVSERWKALVDRLNLSTQFPGQDLYVPAGAGIEAVRVKFRILLGELPRIAQAIRGGS